MSVQWYLHKEGEQQGPFPLDELNRMAESGAISPTDLLWTEGMDKWIQAGQVEGLNLFPPPPPVEKPVPPPPGPAMAQSGKHTRAQGKPVRKKGKGGIIAVFAVVLLLVLGGGFFAYTTFFANGMTAEAESMLADIPEDKLAAIPSEFSFEFEDTKQARELSKRLDDELQNLFIRQQWFFSYPGTVEEALASLELPADAIVVEPYETPIAEIINSTLLYGGVELGEAMGGTWYEEAHVKAEEWQDFKQYRAEVIFTYAEDDTFELLTSNEQQAESPLDEIMETGQWSITIVSPIVDLDQLELVEETLITVMSIDYQF